MKIYVLVGKDRDGNPTFAMPKHFGRSVRAYTSKGTAEHYAKKFGAEAVEAHVGDKNPFESDHMSISIGFSDKLEDTFGRLEIAPNVRAQTTWKMWKENPTIFTVAPGYRVIKEEDGVVLEAELVELSIIPKMLEKK